MKLNIVAYTFLKQFPVPSTELTDDQKCPVRQETEFEIKHYSQDQNDHFRVEFTEPVHGRDTWYVYVPHVLIKDALTPGLRLKVLANTLLKEQPLQSTELAPGETVPIPSDAELDIDSYSTEAMNHYRVKLLEPINGRDTWYVYVPHVSLLDPTGQAVIAQRFNVGIPSDAGWSWPMKGTSCGSQCEFGYARGRLHAGVDIGGFTPDECYAASDGVVKMVKPDPSGAEGRALYIERADRWQHVYFHLQKIMVQEGQSVRRGDLIAIRGGSGFGAEGREIDGGGYSIHLHFEIHQPDGTPVDPRTILPNDGSVPIVG